MKTEESSSSLSSSAEVLSPSSFICTSSVKKEENEKESEGDDDNKDDDDEEDHQWIGFFENITNTNNLDDKDEGNNDDDDDRNEGATVGRSSSSITIKTEDEVPDNIPSKSSMIEMEEEEVDEEIITSCWNSSNILRCDGTWTQYGIACREREEKEETDEEVHIREGNNGNDGAASSIIPTIRNCKENNKKEDEEEEVDAIQNCADYGEADGDVDGDDDRNDNDEDIKEEDMGEDEVDMDTDNTDDGNGDDDGNNNNNNEMINRKKGIWNLEEHERCAESLIPHGHSTSYEAMSNFMKTRSPNQIRRYYTRNKTKLLRDSKKYNNNKHLEYGVENEQKQNDYSVNASSSSNCVDRNDNGGVSSAKRTRHKSQTSAKTNATSNFARRKSNSYDDDDNDRKTPLKKKMRILETTGVRHRLSHQRMSKIINESLLQTEKATTVTKNYMKKEDDNSNDKGYASLAEGISPNTNNASPPAVSTNHCVRRKFNSKNNKDYNDVDDNVDDERNPPPKKKIRILALVEEDINCEADEDHTDDDDGNGDGTSSKTIPTELKYTNKQIEQWNKMFSRLVAYNKKHQTTNVPYKCKEDPQLGAWIGTQRKAYKKEMLSKNRVDLLNGIGFVWKLQDQVPWMEMYQKLIVYKKQHKTTSVPKCYKENPKLASWVLSQRAAYRNKKLSIEQINYLESIGFVWKVCVLWIEMYERLVAYKHCHQSTVVPQRYVKDPSLGMWVTNQRVAYNKDKLSEKRMELLNSIDFVWSVKAGK